MGAQNIIELIIALLVGVGAGWWLARRNADTAATNEQQALEDKLRTGERDLNIVLGELRSQREQVTSLKSELVTASADRKSCEVEIGVLEERVKSLEPLEADWAAKTSEFESLTAEVESLRSKLAAAAIKKSVEPAPPAKLVPPTKPVKTDDTLAAELGSLKQTLSAKESEIATLLVRIKELAPLKLQITDRDLRLREWEAKYAAAIQAKDEELATLANSVSANPTQDQGKDDEITKLQDQIAELNSLLAAQSERDSQLQELQAHHEFMLGEKESQLTDLQSQLGEAETKLESVGSEQISAQGEAMRDKDAAISLLQLRVKELEPLSMQLAERDLKLRRLEERLAEHLEERLDASASQNESVDETRLRELERQHQAALSEQAAEIARLQALLEARKVEADVRVQAPEVASQELARLQELDAENRAELDAQSAEIAKLNQRIRELEPLNAQLFARDARLIELEARLRGAASESESEVRHLNAQIAELAPAGARAEQAEAKLREFERQNREKINNLEVEISGLRVRLAGMEGANAQLEEKLRGAESHLLAQNSLAEK